MLRIAGVPAGSRVCDVGAGVAHLTLKLAERGFEVDAVEPNDAMRANGVRRTEALPNVRWFEGTGEATGMADGVYALVTFGSSFNVCDRPRALKETARILSPRGWFACMWNHRELDDPIQCRIEEIIRDDIPGYGYGTRREDQTAVIAESGLFEDAVTVSGRVVHAQTKADCVEAWRSHATLERQAGERFGAIVDNISGYLDGLPGDSIQVPYRTNIWIARLR
ncbi:class I SAM-dependent methyltransferase [Minwuia thermotolerans]|uniref:class I SAM-dependent methyltransferase n=1 Tax=Minwuia thermotolerans TaxID=2056226 RepID=UPI0019CFAB0F|nr:methyltransferase domain-containing protein [Minwuia thermotolerans]